ncbi:uroporphyrinogen decarboxylase/cobalamine-independent methonine synthase family protein [Mycolicibacterium fluoranthenivorans]|uniref:Methionine synthase II (Cobalamin-independent) n=1 Tax=Mycolicibacterium fluoranthenivorans TaxID=258505 RepID=A0A7X5ZCP8_9MYCO|nr:methionine synthase [Mycolicibacterium fluoranthenivorans]MCV7357327.1 methionine synthase [Mycolicibacterium fluoranthenivorans]NIH95294.1 methionine synthase II (cobalamin-independent) [Mycolicibacterium fluoranthenivorans]
MSIFGTATGIGSWPGTSAREAAEVIVGELHALPHLAELPGRGIGADLIGRAGALLVDIGIDTAPRAYRIAPGRSAVQRRAASLLDEDVDALEEAWEKAGLRGVQGRTVKVQVPGPITLAAQLELSNGHRAITDAGALRDLAASLAEGVAVHRATVARRIGAEVVVQFDEPTLPAALAGRLSGVTSLSSVHPVDAPVAGALLDECARRVGGAVVVHCCAPDLPWKLLRDSVIDAVAVDVAVLGAADLDGVGEFVESGRTVLLGVVPSTAPTTRPTPDQVAAAAAKVTDRLGFARAVLRDRIGITPACGLAGATADWARTAISLAQKAADGLHQDPDAI